MELDFYHINSIENPSDWPKVSILRFFPEVITFLMDIWLINKTSIPKPVSILDMK
jgi:hypothetical protein